MELAERVHAALKPFVNEEPLAGPLTDEEEDREAELGDALIGFHIAAAKIAGGHGMGYDDDVLCANIVKNRIALDGAKQGRGGFEALKRRGVLTVEDADRLIAESDEVVRLITERIAELRSNVWW